MSHDLFSQVLEFDDRRMYPGKRVAGVDEAGRGPLAGPVVAAAVILSPEMPLSQLPGLNDSKQLSASRRDCLFGLIREHCPEMGVGIIDSETIDRINILQATLLAMQKALEELRGPVDLALVDGLHAPRISLPVKPIVKGDQLSASIAAASIIAKVTRDRLMLQAHEQFPQYGFDEHKGYGTRRHLAALKLYGPCPLHRRSYRPVMEALQK